MHLSLARLFCFICRLEVHNLWKPDSVTIPMPAVILSQIKPLCIDPHVSPSTHSLRIQILILGFHWCFSCAHHYSQTCFEVVFAYFSVMFELHCVACACSDHWRTCQHHDMMPAGGTRSECAKVKTLNLYVYYVNVFFILELISHMFTFCGLILRIIHIFHWRLYLGLIWLPTWFEWQAGSEQHSIV